MDESTKLLSKPNSCQQGVLCNFLLFLLKSQLALTLNQFANLSFCRYIMKTIVLFTNSYPFSSRGEYTFIEPELEILNKYFKIIMVPLRKETITPRKLIKDLNNVSVEEVEFNKYKELVNLFKIDSFFVRDFKKIRKINHLKDLIIKHITLKWIEKIIQEKIEKKEWKEEFIYYTYWFDFATTALLRLKSKYNLKVITRVHRYDLYEIRREDYIPFRETDVKKIDYIVTISMQGYNYLKHRYFLNNLYNCYLGINDFHIDNPINANNEVIKIVSCALMSPLKRIDMIMKYLSKVSKDLNIQIIWNHIGDGVLKETLVEQKKELQHNLFDINFVGYLENQDIFEYYKNNSFDYFITLSESEGLPVSLMEATSVSLPIIATNVGGINEIVFDKKNGFLLSENPSYDEFKNKFIEAIIFKVNDKKYISLKKKSKNIFLEKFKAENNHKKFADFLEKL